jgi:hypothetical protein
MVAGKPLVAVVLSRIQPKLMADVASLKKRTPTSLSPVVPVKFAKLAAPPAPDARE